MDIYKDTTSDQQMFYRCATSLISFLPLNMDAHCLIYFLITYIMIQRECQKGKSGSSQLPYDKKIKTICNPGKNYAAVWDIYAAYDIPE